VRPLGWPLFRAAATCNPGLKLEGGGTFLYWCQVSWCQTLHARRAWAAASPSSPARKVAVRPPWRRYSDRKANLAQCRGGTYDSVPSPRRAEPPPRYLADYQGSRENLHLVGRWTRTGPDTLAYEVTIEDSTVWKRPWTVRQEFARREHFDDEIVFLQFLPRRLDQELPGVLVAAGLRVLALWLEHKFTKNEILELYLNRVYFGSGAYGVEAAAQRYFGKSARNVEGRQGANRQLGLPALSAQERRGGE
jgi:hypothetical protein